MVEQPLGLSERGDARFFLWLPLAHVFARVVQYVALDAGAQLAFWRGDLFVAEWGQYLSKRFGRRVVRADLRPNGTARRVTVFASGFAHPLALLVDRGGGLLVADWGPGIVYRIHARS